MVVIAPKCRKAKGVTIESFAIFVNEKALVTIKKIVPVLYHPVANYLREFSHIIPVAKGVIDFRFLFVPKRTEEMVAVAQGCRGLNEAVPTTGSVSLDALSNATNFG